MRALVVYESMFGNTEQVARAIGEGLAPYGDVRVVEVGDASPSLEAVDLLVVGGPTHAFGMTRESTRAEAQKQAARQVVSRSRGLREWLALLPDIPAVAVATFDTKVHKARRLPGSGSAAARLLRKRGRQPIATAESFYVEDTLGPLLEGELVRANAWGSVLAHQVAVRS